MHSLLVFTATALLAFGASAFPTQTQLNCRSSPSTSSRIVKVYGEGADIKISCQTTGTTVETSNVWDKTQDDCYVADYYVKTGHAGIFTTRCGGGGGSSCGPPPINDATVNLIKDFEGFVRSPGPDPVGLLTVGYGHLCKQRGCAEVKYKFPLTPQTAALLLQDDARIFENCVSNSLKDSVKLNDNQYGALVSWAFNVGCGNVQSSSLIQRLNHGENKNVVASQELIKWNKAGSPLHVIPGLTRRRKAEIALFKEPSSVQALPPKC